MAYNPFSAPVPGQSLTKPRGGMPMERPPQFTDINDAAEYVWDRLTQPKQVVRLLAQIKDGVPVEYIVRTILFEGVMQGKWSPDIALNLAQICTWQIEALAKAKGLGYVLKNPDNDQDEFLAQFDFDSGKTAKEPEEEVETKSEAPQGLFFRGK